MKLCMKLYEIMHENILNARDAIARPQAEARLILWDGQDTSPRMCLAFLRVGWPCRASSCVVVRCLSLSCVVFRSLCLYLSLRLCLPCSVLLCLSPSFRFLLPMLSYFHALPVHLRTQVYVGAVFPLLGGPGGSWRFPRRPKTP